MSLLSRHCGRCYRQLATTTTPTAVNCIRRWIGFTPMTPPSLTSIVDIDKLSKEDSGTIESIWISYHNDDDTDSIINKRKSTMASALVLCKEDADTIKIRAKMSPLFILPVFKESSDSFLLLLSQYQEKHGFILTYLEEYKRNPETASPWMSLMLYSEFEISKGISLVRSDFTPNITKKENVIISQILVDVYRAQDMYDAHVHTFNKEPSKFDFDKYILTCKNNYSQRFLLK